ncbi:condensation domain-containing protein [Streptomyces sp. NPDC100445]|uniref:condensation domain-containing protein n=1 Tax=Streptomyces sp. NPDC100445 TaxID=3366102 RepID=UPI0037F8F923
MTDLVQDLCRLFARALELEYVTEDTDFYLAGGHSLSALALAVSVEEAVGLPVRVRDILECATPELLAARLAEARGGAAGPRTAPEAGPDAGRARDGGTPADADAPADAEVPESVRWLWLARQHAHGGDGAYTVPCLLRGEGDVDVDRLAAAVAILPARHPALRTVFVERRGTVRAVVTDRTAPLDVVDLRGDSLTEEEFEALVHDRVEVPFDLAQGPLFRSTLFLRPDGAWSLLFTADHLVCDGRSLTVLAAELVAAYRQDGALLPAPVPGPRPAPRPREESLAHWRELLTPPPAPLLLPVDRPRSAPAGVATDTVSLDIEPGTTDRLGAVAATAHAGLFASLAAAVASGLGGLTRTDDVCLGTPVDRRSPLGLDGAVGFHVATVPLRLDLAGRDDPAALVRHVAARTADALDHSEVAFDELVAALDPPRPAGRGPFFDVWVALFPRIDTGPAGPGGIALRGGPFLQRRGMFELSFQFVAEERGLRLCLQYDTGRYDRDTAEQVAGRVLAELGRLAGGSAVSGEPAQPPGAPPAPAFQGFRFDA